MTSAKIKSSWDPIHANCFEIMKKKIARETQLTYPDFSKPFEIHTHASKVQLGACISQDGKPIAFCSRKQKFALLEQSTPPLSKSFSPSWTLSKNSGAFYSVKILKFTMIMKTWPTSISTQTESCADDPSSKNTPQTFNTSKVSIMLWLTPSVDYHSLMTALSKKL
jgi:hypothetical protein